LTDTPKPTTLNKEARRDFTYLSLGGLHPYPELYPCPPIHPTPTPGKQTRHSPLRGQYKPSQNHLCADAVTPGTLQAWRNTTRLELYERDAIRPTTWNFTRPREYDRPPGTLRARGNTTDTPPSLATLAHPPRGRSLRHAHHANPLNPRPPPSC
jgi:hypothetical protein